MGLQPPDPAGSARWRRQLSQAEVGSPEFLAQLQAFLKLQNPSKYDVAAPPPKKPAPGKGDAGKGMKGADASGEGGDWRLARASPSLVARPSTGADARFPSRAAAGTVVSYGGKKKDAGGAAARGGRAQSHGAASTRDSSPQKDDDWEGAEASWQARRRAPPFPAPTPPLQAARSLQTGRRRIPAPFPHPFQAAAAAEQLQEDAAALQTVLLSNLAAEGPDAPLLPEDNPLNFTPRDPRNVWRMEGQLYASQRTFLFPRLLNGRVITLIQGWKARHFHPLPTTPPPPPPPTPLPPHPTPHTHARPAGARGRRQGRGAVGRRAAPRGVPHGARGAHRAAPPAVGTLRVDPAGQVRDAPRRTGRPAAAAAVLGAPRAEREA